MRSSTCSPTLTIGQWQTLHRFARHQGLSSAVWREIRQHGLEDHVAEKIRNQFEATSKQDAARSMALHSQLNRVLQHLHDVGLQVVVLKGAALAYTLYPDPACRTMRDIDLLVRKQDVNATVKALVELGYRTTPMPEHLDARVEGHVLLIAPGTGAKIELQYFPGRNFFPALEQDNNGSFWSRIQPVTIAGAPAYELGREDTLAYLCYHTAHHSYQVYCFRALYDITLLLMGCDTTLDWQRVIRFARNHTLQHAIALPLLLAKHLYHAPVPDIIQDHLTTPWLRKRALGVALKLALNTDHRVERVPPPGRELLQRNTMTGVLGLVCEEIPSSVKQKLSSWNSSR